VVKLLLGEAGPWDWSKFPRCSILEEEEDLGALVGHLEGVHGFPLVGEEAKVVEDDSDPVPVTYMFLRDD
jgi:hypothetical protein